MEQLGRFHFLDLNGKDVAQDRKGTEEKTYRLGNKLGIPVVSGSDTHQAVQYGCIRTKFEKEIITVSDLYAEMKKERMRFSYLTMLLSRSGQQEF